MSAPAAAATERIATAFAGHGKRAALMPYLMGGHPDVPTSVAAAKAAAEAGADLIELGVPFSDPLADGPGDPRRRDRGSGRRHHPMTCSACARRPRGTLPVILMVYANVVLRPGVERSTRRGAGGASGLIVPDLPHDEAGDLRAPATGRASRSCHWSRPPPPPSDSARSAPTHAASSTPSRSRAPPASGPSCRLTRRHGGPCPGATDVPGGRRLRDLHAEHARAVAEVADGVIVGSRVVRAASEGGAMPWASRSRSSPGCCRVPPMPSSRTQPSAEDPKAKDAPKLQRRAGLRGSRR